MSNNILSDSVPFAELISSDPQSIYNDIHDLAPEAIREKYLERDYRDVSSQSQLIQIFFKAIEQMRLDIVTKIAQVFEIATIYLNINEEQAPFFKIKYSVSEPISLISYKNPLVIAAKNNDMPMLDFFFKYFGYVHSIPRYEIALRTAAENNNVELIKNLIAHMKGDPSHNLLNWARFIAQIKEYSNLNNYLFNTYPRDNEFSRVELNHFFELAVLRGKLDIVNFLVKMKNVKINLASLIDEGVSTFRLPVIAIAIQQKNLAMVNKLISLGANLTLDCPVHKETLIHFAVRCSTDEIIQSLLNALKSDKVNKILNTANTSSNTPLSLVIEQKNLFMVDTLISYGVKLTETFDEDKNTVLHFAIKWGSYEIVQSLLKAIEPVVANKMLLTQNELRQTPIHLAVQLTKVKMLKLFFKHYPHSKQALNLHDNNNHSPLHLSRQNLSLIRLLLDHGANPLHPKDHSVYKNACSDIIFHLNGENNFRLQSSQNEYVLSFLFLIIFRNAQNGNIHSFIDNTQPNQNILLADNENTRKIKLWKKNISEEITHFGISDKVTLFASSGNSNETNSYREKIPVEQEFRDHTSNNFNTNTLN